MNKQIPCAIIYDWLLDIQRKAVDDHLPAVHLLHNKSMFDGDTRFDEYGVHRFNIGIKELVENFDGKMPFQLE